MFYSTSESHTAVKSQETKTHEWVNLPIDRWNQNTSNVIQFRVNSPRKMSDDTEPVIHTIGSLDKHDRTNLGEDISGSKEDIPSGVDSKLDNTGDRAERGSGDTFIGPGTQGDIAGAHTMSESRILGKVQTVGTADPAHRDATASSGMKSKQGQ